MGILVMQSKRKGAIEETREGTALILDTTTQGRTTHGVREKKSILEEKEEEKRSASAMCRDSASWEKPDAQIVSGPNRCRAGVQSQKKSCLGEKKVIR